MSINKINNEIINDPYAITETKSPIQVLEEIITALALNIFPQFKEILIKPSIEEKIAKAVQTAICNYTYHIETILLQNPMDYAANLVELEQSGFTNDTPIGISGNGGIVPLASGEKSNALTQHLLIAMIAKTYGIEMAERMTRRYNLDKNSQLNIGEFKRILIGLAANIRTTDLDLIFAKVKQADNDHVFVNQLEKYNPQMVQRLQQSGETPTSMDYAFLLEMLRLVRVDGNAVPVVQALFQDQSTAEKVYGKKKETVDHFVEWMDYKAAFHAGTWDQLRTNLDGLPHSYEIAIAEFFGKSLAYDELRQGMVFTIPNKNPNGSPTTYSLVDSLAHKGDAVHGFFFSEDRVPANEVQNLHLAFRGTAFSNQMLDAEASLYRDGALHQIGKAQFDKREKEIVSRLERYLESQPNNQVVLNISGHSLGGADAQRALVLITEAVANSDKNSPLRKIKKIECTPHNTPGLEESLNSRFDAAMKKIEADEQLREQVQVEVNYVMHWFKLDGQYVQDVVQQVGDCFVGANLSSSNLKRRVYNVYNDHIELDTIYSPKGINTALEVHSQRVFNPILYPYAPKIEFVDEVDQKELLEKTLNRALEIHSQLKHPNKLVDWMRSVKWPIELFNGKLHKFAVMIIQFAKSLETDMDHRFV